MINCQDHRFVVFLALALLDISTYLCFSESVENSHSAILDANGRYYLKWRSDNEEIVFETHVETLGWLALGFSPNGGMLNADVVSGWVDDDGKVYLQDRFAKIDKAMPSLDYIPNYELLSGYENGTHTVLSFSRKLKTCDSEDRDINFGTTRLIWSFHDEDPVDEDIYYHEEKRGTRSLNLLETASFQPPPMPEVYYTLDLLQDKASIASDVDTTYWCRAIKMPSLAGKHHIFKYEPIIQLGNEAIVHHIVTYQCHQSINDSFDGFGLGHDCYNPNMPDELNECFFISFAWAIGGEAYYFPEDVGYPIGSADDPSYWLLEVHYDNPQLQPGVIDSSGLRIYYTPELRKFEAEVLMTGSFVNKQLMVPPHSSAFTITGFCNSECTNQAFAHGHSMENPVSEIKIIAAFLHSHLAGRSILARHFRGSEELPPILSETTYDFNLQTLMPLKEEVVVKPGDSLITQCVYNTEDRDNVTYGGLATSDEMCLNFFMYYPRLPFATCVSGPNPAAILWSLTAENFELSYDFDEPRVVVPHRYANMTYQEVIATISWTDRDRKAVEVAPTVKPYTYYCGGQNDQQSFETSGAEEPFYITEFYQDEACSTDGTAQTSTFNHLLIYMLSFLLLSQYAF